MLYRADVAKKQSDGATVWRTEWMGAPSLARINDCRLVCLAGDMRRTVYITGEPDTYFSVPAVAIVARARVRGFVTQDDDGNLVFRHTYY
jgi:hypothetical protein